jgi:hypothetical protein
MRKDADLDDRARPSGRGRSAPHANRSKPWGSSLKPALRSGRFTGGDRRRNVSGGERPEIPVGDDMCNVGNRLTLGRFPAAQYPPAPPDGALIVPSCLVRLNGYIEQEIEEGLRLADEEPAVTEALDRTNGSEVLMRDRPDHGADG